MVAKLAASSPVAIVDGVGPTVPAAALCRPLLNAEGGEEPQATSLWPGEHCSLQGSTSVAACGNRWLTCPPAAALCDNAEVMCSWSL